MAGLPIARMGDPISCGDVIMQASGDVFCNGMPVARDGDLTAGHCFSPTALIATSSTVTVNGIPIVRQGDAIQTHCCGPSCHSGTVSVGSPDGTSG